MGQNFSMPLHLSNALNLKYKEDSGILYRLSLIFSFLCSGLQPTWLKIKILTYDIR